MRLLIVDLNCPKARSLHEYNMLSSLPDLNRSYCSPGFELKQIRVLQLETSDKRFGTSCGNINDVNSTNDDHSNFQIKNNSYMESRHAIITYNKDEN